MVENQKGELGRWRRELMRQLVLRINVWGKAVVNERSGSEVKGLGQG